MKEIPIAGFLLRIPGQNPRPWTLRRSLRMALPFLAGSSIACGRVALPEPASAPAVPEFMVPGTTLWTAARSGDTMAVTRELDGGMDINAVLMHPYVPGNGGTALHASAAVNQMEVALLLIRRGANLNAQAIDEYGGTPLHWASSQGHAAMVGILLQAGASANALDIYGSSPLDATNLPSVGGRKRKRLVREVLEAAGARESVSGIHPVADPDLWAAITSGDAESAQKAISSGADVNVPEPIGGVTPLFQATLMGREEICRKLLLAGAKTDSASKDGSTPLMVAAYMGHANLVALLLANGADQTRRGGDGKTALEKVTGPWTPELMAEYTRIGTLFGIATNLEQIRVGREAATKLLTK